MAKNYTRDEWDEFVRKAMKETVEWMLNATIFNDALTENICDNADFDFLKEFPKEVDVLIDDYKDKVYEVVTRDVCGFPV